MNRQIKKRNVVEAIKKMDNENQKQHEIIKVDNKIRMVRYTHPKPA